MNRIPRPVDFNTENDYLLTVQAIAKHQGVCDQTVRRAIQKAASFREAENYERALEFFCPFRQAPTQRQAWEKKLDDDGNIQRDRRGRPVYVLDSGGNRIPVGDPTKSGIYQISNADYCNWWRQQTGAVPPAQKLELVEA